MTAFVKDQFLISGGNVSYCLDPMPCAWERRIFIARFKYGGTGSARPYATFLRKHFTVEEYQTLRAQGGDAVENATKARGWIMSHIKTWLKRDGYPVTTAGYDAWFAKHMDATRARIAERAAAVAP